MMKKKFAMLVGLPGVGKSTFRHSNMQTFVQISSDDFIDQYAAAQGKTYNEVFKDVIDEATEFTKNALKNAIAFNSDVVIDRTNMSVKSRRQYLSQVPDSYRKIAYVFSLPNLMDDPASQPWFDRLNNRPGKTIPFNVLKSMHASFQQPTLEEGFDEIHDLNWLTHSERSVTSRFE